MGKCPQCGAFNTMVEEVMHDEAVSKGQRSVRGLSGRSQPRPIGQVGGDTEERIHLPMGEFARVLGGGIVPGSIVLVGGDPGIGKSTLMLQMALEMAAQKRVLYVSGEESERQIKMRATRIGEGAKSFPPDLLLVTETNLEVILNHVNEVKPDLLIVEFDPDRLPPRAGFFGRLGLAGARVRLPPARAGQIERDFGLPDRARHERGRHRRAARAGAYRRYGALSRRRPLPGLPAAALGQEPLWRHL